LQLIFFPVLPKPGPGHSISDATGKIFNPEKADGAGRLIYGRGDKPVPLRIRHDFRSWPFRLLRRIEAAPAPDGKALRMARRQWHDLHRFIPGRGDS
jgi:hypothetical protein